MTNVQVCAIRDYAFPFWVMCICVSILIACNLKRFDSQKILPFERLGPELVGP
jgi:hypothetical protein